MFEWLDGPKVIKRNIFGTSSISQWSIREDIEKIDNKLIFFYVFHILINLSW